MISLGSQKCSAIAEAAGVLRWMGTDCSGRTGWEDEETEKPFTKEQLECMEPCSWTVEKSVERLWVRISG